MIRRKSCGDLRVIAGVSVTIALRERRSQRCGGASKGFLASLELAPVIDCHFDLNDLAHFDLF